ncbi:MAG: hypothetical protein ACRDHE_05020, partial [Ktedonobacterales bacterium]
MKRARHDGGERQTTVATPPAHVESDLHSVLAETEYMLWGSDDDADVDAELAAPVASTSVAATPAAALPELDPPEVTRALPSEVAPAPWLDTDAEPAAPP